VTGTVPALAALAPGEAVVRDDGIAVVRAADGLVELLAGRDDTGASEESEDDDDERAGIDLDVQALAGRIAAKRLEGLTKARAE